MKIKNWHFWVFISAIVYVLPIMLSNVSYIDDMGRFIDGYGWRNDGRVFSDYVIYITTFGNGIVTIFPFSLILAALVFAISGMIVSHILLDIDTKFKRVSGFVFIASPFLLENMAYKFDSLPMSLSVFFAVLPFLIKNKYRFVATSIMCLVLVFGLYQTSAMLYLGIVLCVLIKGCAKNERLIDFNLIGCAIVSFFSAYVAYYCLLSILDLSVGRATFLPLDKSSVDIITNRVSAYYSVYKQLFDGGYALAVLPLVILTAISLVSMVLNGVGAISVIMMAVYFFGVYLLVMLPNLVLVTGWITARTFICFPLLTYAAVVIASQCKLKIHDGIYVASLLVLFGFSFFVSSVFGSTLKVNDDYSIYIAQNVSNDISEDSAKDGHKVIISGQRPVPINNKITLSSFQFINILTRNYMVEGWVWGVRDLSRYMRMNSVPNNAVHVRERCSWTVLKSRKEYHLLKKNDMYMIDFNYQVCNVAKK